MTIPVMTAQQSAVLVVIDQLNRDEFSGWFYRSSVMAFCQVESAFRPHAYRKEPSGVASYGLMQVLDITAASMGLKGSPEQMYDPVIGVRIGMKVARNYWDALAKHFGRDPTCEQWCASYNEGPGNVFRGRPDLSYVNVWMAARAHWKPLDDAA